MKYFGGCDVGSTYAKCVILDENGKIIADATVRSKINPVKSAELALGEAISKVPELSSPEDLTYLIGTAEIKFRLPTKIYLKSVATQWVYMLQTRV